jgi:type IV secretion system protein VirD4
MILILELDYGGAVTRSLTDLWAPLQKTLLQPEIQPFLWLLGSVFLLKFFTGFSGGKRQLTTGQWASIHDKLRSVLLARKQISSTRINDVVLWCGSFDAWKMQGIFPHLWLLLTRSVPTLFLTNANQSFGVIGSANSGKTFSAINPMCLSAIQQGMSMVLYDYKADDRGEGGQMAYLAALAARYGYNVRVFSPGRDYTCIINPLDFLDHANDDTTAAVLAEVFHKNLKRSAGKGDAFFGPAGQRLIQALIQFAKSTQYPDLAMAFAVLQLEDLPKRLAIAAQSDRLPPFIKVGFAQIIAATDSEKTTASIIATASDVLTRFMSPRILPALMGKTNLPLVLDGKQLVIFHSDIFRQDVLNPLIAAMINIVMQKNVSVQRKQPIVFCADELPTIYIPKLPTWPNEHRSKGFVGILGFQTLSQLKEAYGDHDSDTLLSGLGTQFWFNPNNEKTAQIWQTFLGETEIRIRTKGWSRSGGKSGGGRSFNEQVHKKSLLTTDEILGFRQGECILRSPGIQNRQRSRIPWHIKSIRIPKKDQRLIDQCEEMWRSRLIHALTEIEKTQRPPLDILAAIKVREAEADRLLPLSVQDTSPTKQRVPHQSQSAKAEQRQGEEEW